MGRCELGVKTAPHGVPEHLPGPEPEGQPALEQQRVSRLDVFCVELAISTQRVQRDRQNSGHRPQAHDAHQQQTEDQRVNRAERVEKQTDRPGKPQ